MRIDDRAIARWRFRSQLFEGRHASHTAEAVSTLLGVQAENLGQTAWALACRTTGREARLDELLADATLIRTHVLRTTWHLVHRDDAAWLVELTGPRIRRLAGQQLSRDHGVSETEADRIGEVVSAALAEAPGRTREELATVIADAGCTLSSTTLMVLLVRLAGDGLICSGSPRVEGPTATQTYALLAARVPPSPYSSREEALGTLAARYFTGHGPATERDLAYWATLPLGDVRKGIAAAAGELASFDHDGRTFWHAADQEPPQAPRKPVAHLLHLLDEWYRGYQDSRMVVDTAGHHPRGREPGLGLAVIDGQIAGLAARTVTDRGLHFEVRPYRQLSASELAALTEEAGAYGRFLDLPATLTLAPHSR
ncbi:MAG TPA: winged helix DNA-binding domain-containing protein [Marmoricola sp.]